MNSLERTKLKKLKTKKFSISSKDIKPELIKEASDLLLNNEVVAFPTETVYGLGAVITSEDALKKIYKAKGRPIDNPLIVHISDYSMLEDIVKEIPEKAKILTNELWPGPLTIILKKKDSISSIVSAGLDTVGVRMPSNTIAHSLIDATDIPIAAPSANISGKPSVTTSNYLVEDLDSKVAGLILSEDSEIGFESTVIDMTVEPPMILRPGFYSKEDIEKVIGAVSLSEGITLNKEPDRPASPGMKYKHYSPNANVILIKSDNEDEFKAKFKSLVNNKNKEYAFIFTTEDLILSDFPNLIIKKLGVSEEDFGHHIFSALRDADKEGAELILVQIPQKIENSLAIMDRLLHASNYTVY